MFLFDGPRISEMDAIYFEDRKMHKWTELCSYCTQYELWQYFSSCEKEKNVLALLGNKRTSKNAFLFHLVIGMTLVNLTVSHQGCCNDFKKVLPPWDGNGL
jgi:hypothetical protein